MARIYISIAFSNLIEQKQAVVKTVKELGHEAVSVEINACSDMSALDKCLRSVRSSDSFIGIFDGRNSSIPNDRVNSIAHSEFEEARKRGIPCHISFFNEIPHLVELVKRSVLNLNSSTANAISSEDKKNYLCSNNTEKPDAVRRVELAGIRTQKNNKGHWEADFGDGIIMIYIPEGDFFMGTDDGKEFEKPRHKVYLDAYWIGKYIVTVAQYSKFTQETKSHLPTWMKTFSKDYQQFDEALTGEDYPIVGVSWEDSLAYSSWLSQRLKKSFFLPTEAQWEKAARGTDELKFPWGNSQPTGSHLNFADLQLFKKEKFDWADSSIDDGYAFTSPVGSYPAGASPCGALDMVGNVWEWCQDWNHGDYYKESPYRNPKGPEIEKMRSLRGGGWNVDKNDCRCTFRFADSPNNSDCFTGFRLAMLS